jgi:hypothetical protein
MKMAQANPVQVDANRAKSKGLATLRNALQNLPHALAFFQFMLVFLPFGLCSITGTSIPYSNQDFIIAFVLLLAGSGPALAFIAFVLMKWQRRGSDPENATTLKGKSLLMPLVAYGSAVLGILLFFIEQDGWISELVPMLVYFVGMLVSGALAMLGLMKRQDVSDDALPGLDLALALGIIGGLYLIPANFGLPSLLLVEIIVTLSIPPILALTTTNQRTAAPTGSTQQTEPSPFAWCDRFLQTGDGPRTFMGTAIMLLLVLAFGNLFSAIFYLNRPFPMYATQAIAFFIATACIVLVFTAIFKKRDATILFIIVLACVIVTMVLGDFVRGFSNNPVLLAISGVAAGGGLSLLFKFQETRKKSERLKDFSGNRVLETFYYILLSTLLGLIYNLTISWEGLLREPMAGNIPARLLIGGVILAFAVIILSVFSANARYLTGMDRGVVKKKAESMEELVSGGSKGVDPTVAAMLGGVAPSNKAKQKGTDAKVVDPMVAGMLGGGAPSKKAKDKGTDVKAKLVDPMIAGMLGGGTLKKKEPEIVSKPVVPVPSAPVPVKPVPSVPVPVKLAPAQIPDHIRKIKALLLISKRVKIENVREALGLDNDICDIVLGIWTNELGIDVTGGFVDFKDIEIDKIVNILEAFLAEWNKPEGNDAKP